MTFAHPEALVSTEWLGRRLNDPDIAIVDASWHLPDADRDAAAEFAAAHIPGAVRFDIDEIADKASGLPHMAPSAADFSTSLGALGIGDGQQIVVYDCYGGFSAATRVWWMFRLFGHGNVAVLDGGLPKWQAEDRPIDADSPEVQSRKFAARRDERLVRNLAQVLVNIESETEQFLDARSAGRFNGTEPEPRPGIRSGHVPGSYNLPFPLLMDGDNFNVMRSAPELNAAFDAAGIDPAKPVISSCGSGVTAGVAVFALYLLGHENAAVYDGSWTDWGGRDDTPVEL